jgi:hypothetical protein
MLLEIPKNSIVESRIEPWPSIDEHISSEHIDHKDNSRTLKSKSNLI